MSIHYEDDSVVLHHGDCLEVMRTLPDASVDAVVTDPPYGLEFMGREWDSFKGDAWRNSAGITRTGYTDGGNRIARPSYGGGDSANPTCATCGGRKRGAKKCACPEPDWRVKGKPLDQRQNNAAQMRAFQEWCELWTAECLRVLKPGGHLLAFGGTRTWHRLACAVEDAGFEVRDSIAWMSGSGFPKSLNASKAMKESGRACTCPEPTTEHDVRSLRNGDVPQAEGSPRGPGAVLLPSLPEQGAPAAGRSELRTAEDGRGEPRMERRGDLSQGEGQLRGAEVRSVPTGVPADGTVGRLHYGAPSRDGSVDRPDADQNGVREPQESRPEGQPAGESGALPDQRRSQAWGGWPVCGRCSQPVIPDGLGTALKPSHEPVVVARKPLAGTVAANVLEHGTGALNIAATRVAATDKAKFPAGIVSDTEDIYGNGAGRYADRPRGEDPSPAGRWPANVLLDDSQAEVLDEQSGDMPGGNMPAKRNGIGYMEGGTGTEGEAVKLDGGGASRFFPTFRYEAKAPKSERPKVNGTAHPTVKPLELCRWLVRLVTPPGGTVLEPFAGSGTTVEACVIEGFKCVAIEKTDEYLPLITQRINRRRDPVAYMQAAGDDLGLFDLEEDTA